MGSRALLLQWYVPECRRNTNSVSAIVPLVHMQFSGMVH